MRLIILTIVFAYALSELGNTDYAHNPPPPVEVYKPVRALRGDSGIIDIKVAEMYVNGRRFVTLYR